MKRVLIVTLALLTTPDLALSDAHCAYHRYVHLWAEHYEVTFEESLKLHDMAGMDQIIADKYRQFLSLAMEEEDARAGLERFSGGLVAENIRNPEYSQDLGFLYSAMHDCVKWMWE